MISFKIPQKIWKLIHAYGGKHQESKCKMSIAAPFPWQDLIKEIS